MKAFFSSMLQPKPGAKPDAATAAPRQPLAPANAGANAAATAAAPSAAAAAAAAASPPVPASPVAATAATSTLPTAATPTPTPAPAHAINSVDKKNAKVALDAYVGVLQSVFDHQAPVRKEAEYFLQHMDDWTGRDPTAELPKANFAARCVNVELPLVREKGTVALQDINAQLQSCLSGSHSFLAAASAKDIARRDLSIASLSRLKSLQVSLERDTAEAVKTQHNLYVLEYQRMHDRLGRNMDGSRKSSGPATQVSDIIMENGAESAAAATVAGAPSNDAAAVEAASGDDAARALPAAADTPAADANASASAQ